MAKTSGGIRTWNMAVSQGSATRASVKRQTAEEKIMAVFADFDKQGYSRQQPFAVGKVEKRMSDFAKANNITLGSDQLYMSSRSLGHGRRDSKVAKGIAASREELANFPKKRRSMRLYYDKIEKRFVYATNTTKYIVDPDYELKISRKQTKKVAFITATKIDGTEFNMSKYIRVK